MYGSDGASVATALEKQVNLRVTLQLNPEELVTLKTFMDLYEVREPNQALRLAVSMGVATGSRFTELQRLKMRIIVNEIRSWLVTRAAKSYAEIVEELKATGFAIDDELQRAQEEYNAASQNEDKETP